MSEDKLKENIWKLIQEFDDEWILTEIILLGKEGGIRRLMISDDEVEEVRIYG